MLEVTEKSLRYRPGESVIEYRFLLPDWENFPGNILSCFDENSFVSTWFDDWATHFPREQEWNFVQQITVNTLQRRTHIRWLSTAESIEIFLAYYEEKWYKNIVSDSYEIPPEEQLSFSLSLRHLLWCEKDKKFLSQKNSLLYNVSPPLRSPRDLRILQQAARRGIVSWIEIYPGDEKYIPLLLEREILTPFQVSQILFFSWKKRWFLWQEEIFPCPI